MSDLVWTRVPDGAHNSRPTYEYHAGAHDRKYNIVWAYDAGFGFTARNAGGYMTDRWGIVWARTLKRCKAACQTLEDRYCDK